MGNVRQDHAQQDDVQQDRARSGFRAKAFLGRCRGLPAFLPLAFLGLAGCNMVPTAGSGQSVSDAAQLPVVRDSIILRGAQMTMVRGNVETPISNRQMAVVARASLDGLRFYPGSKIEKISMVQSEGRSTYDPVSGRAEPAPTSDHVSVRSDGTKTQVIAASTVRQGISQPDDAGAVIKTIGIHFVSPARPMDVGYWMADALPAARRFFIATLTPNQITGGIEGGSAFSLKLTPLQNGQTRGLLEVHER